MKVRMRHKAMLEQGQLLCPPAASSGARANDEAAGRRGGGLIAPLSVDFDRPADTAAPAVVVEGVALANSGSGDDGDTNARGGWSGGGGGDGAPGPGPVMGVDRGGRGLEVPLGQVVGTL
jgi:hypothetical protein